MRMRIEMKMELVVQVELESGEGGRRQAEVGHAYPLAAFSQVKLVKLGTKAVLISKLKRLSFTSDFTTYI